MAASMIHLPLVFLMALFALTHGQFFPIHPSPFFLQPQALIPFPYAHPASLAHGGSSQSQGPAASAFSFNPYASASSMAPVAVIPVPVPAVPLPLAPASLIPASQSASQSSSSSSSANTNEPQQEISDRSSSTAKSSASSPFAGFSLKSLQLPNDLADKIFPFTIRIASHGEPHMP